jgi:hypothetical protein
VAKKQQESTQVTFNCSDALLMAPQALFYSQMLQALYTARLPYKKNDGDPLCIDPTNYFDPEDQLADIMQGMV